MDAVGLYPNIPHEEGLASLYTFLENSENKQISSDTLAEIAEIVWKNNIFEFDKKTFKRKRGTAIGMKFVLKIFFMADLEKKMLAIFEKESMIWWRYIDDIFFILENRDSSSFYRSIQHDSSYNKI